MAQGVIHAPILARIAEEVYSLIKNDAALRKIQGTNAPRAYYFDRQAAVTGTTVYTITEAKSGSEIFSSMVVQFDTASGAGFYRIDGQNPSATVGFEVPAGGGILQINGHDNIKNFALIAQAASTLVFSRYLYK
jgi:hypothetical protein